MAAHMQAFINSVILTILLGDQKLLFGLRHKMPLHILLEIKQEVKRYGWSCHAALLGSKPAKLPIDSPSLPSQEECILGARTRLTSAQGH